ncbi:hypothetical protein PSTA9_03987 [Pseudomonas syringae pv. tomato]|uniref:Uncharacterized protein n=1 Tax=Pseudomonas syringae pv. tomato TaxID=323 RepID=A0AAV1BQC2_PSEUB|nr:hypothetical protein PSTA9_03987 [Pseudomonas syringae pv. tomato]CAI8956961.1 hypothetical protein DAPPPG215_23310 [Pseudomonas syringae pv. tomato]
MPPHDSPARLALPILTYGLQPVPVPTSLTAHFSAAIDYEIYFYYLTTNGKPGKSP